MNNNDFKNNITLKKEGKLVRANDQDKPKKMSFKKKKRILRSYGTPEFMSYEELKRRLLAIPSQKERALLCYIYACMARESEIIRPRYKKDAKSICVDAGIIHDNKLELRLRTGKTNKPRKIFIFKNREKWLYDILVGWAERIGDGEMFPFKRGLAEKIFSKHFPELKAEKGTGDGNSKHTIHWLRGWRYTHYRRGNITGKRVESVVASLFGGWVTSVCPEKYYDFTRIEDFEEELENLED